MLNTLILGRAMALLGRLDRGLAARPAHHPSEDGFTWYRAFFR
jgi:hypothetical protein